MTSYRFLQEKIFPEIDFCRKTLPAIKMLSALNNQLRLICRKTNQTKLVL